MKKILVPVDFSTISIFAIDAAIKFAKKIKADIHIYHSVNIPDDWEDLPAETRYKDEVNKARAIKVRDKLQTIKSQIEREGIACDTFYTGGKFIENINEITDKTDYDLIIMGSHGVSGKKEWFIGSNTQKVIRKIHTNLLVVKDKIEHLTFDNVLFASSMHIEDKEAFEKFLEAIEPLDMKKIHVITVNTSSFFTQPGFLMKEQLKEFKNIANRYDVETTFYPDFSVEAGIRHYVEDNNIDLVGISNHLRHPVKRIFQGSNVEMVINHSAVPVLSIDYK